MTTVWVAFTEVEDDAGWTVGVYSTPELARLAVESKTACGVWTGDDSQWMTYAVTQRPLIGYVVQPFTINERPV